MEFYLFISWCGGLIFLIIGVHSIVENHSKKNRTETPKIKMAARDKIMMFSFVYLTTGIINTLPFFFAFIVLILSTMDIELWISKYIYPVFFYAGLVCIVLSFVCVLLARKIEKKRKKEEKERRKKEKLSILQYAGKDIFNFTNEMLEAYENVEEIIETLEDIFLITDEMIKQQRYFHLISQKISKKIKYSEEIPEKIAQHFVEQYYVALCSYWKDKIETGENL